MKTDSKKPYSKPLLKEIVKRVTPGLRDLLESELTAEPAIFYRNLADRFGAPISPILSDQEKRAFGAAPAREGTEASADNYSIIHDIQLWEMGESHAEIQTELPSESEAPSGWLKDIKLVHKRTPTDKKSGDAANGPDKNDLPWAPLLRLRLALWPQEFGARLLPHFARLPFSPLHHQIFAWRRRTLGSFSAARQGQRLAIAAPRGAAKTTVGTLFTALHALLYSTERYIVIVSATLPQSQKRVQQIGRELLENHRLRWLYPPLNARDFHRGIKGTRLELSGPRVEAKSPGSEMRGMMHGAWRPTLIILDDAEPDHVADSAKWRERMIEWFQDVIEPLGDRYTSIVALGTLLHRESLLAHLLERPDFEGHRFGAVESWATNVPLWRRWRQLYQRAASADAADGTHAIGGSDAAADTFFRSNQPAMLEGARVLWPEKEPYLHLMQQLVAMGPRAFAKEKMNEPHDQVNALFHLAQWRYFRVVEDRLVFGCRPLWLGQQGKAPENAGRNAGECNATAEEQEYLAWLADDEPGVARPSAAGKRNAPPDTEVKPEGEIRLSDLTVIGYLDSATGAAMKNGDDAAIAGAYELAQRFMPGRNTGKMRTHSRRKATNY